MLAGSAGFLLASYAIGRPSHFSQIVTSGHDTGSWVLLGKMLKARTVWTGGLLPACLLGNLRDMSHHLLI